MGRLYAHPETGGQFKRRLCNTHIFTDLPSGSIPWRPLGEAKKLQALVLTKKYAEGMRWERVNGGNDEECFSSLESFFFSRNFSRNLLDIDRNRGCCFWRKKPVMGPICRSHGLGGLLHMSIRGNEE